jgi:hypothetical protein
MYSCSLTLGPVFVFVTLPLRLREGVRMYCVQPVLPILGLRPIVLVYCNPSLLGYIMKVTPLLGCAVFLYSFDFLDT